MDYKAVVIGGGPGGYVCAIRLGQLGQKVLLIERDTVGGVCLQRGCIPSKALIHIAGLYRSIQGASRMGIQVDGLSLDWARTQLWKTSVVRRLTRGVQTLLLRNGAETIKGEADLVDAHTVRIRTSEGDRSVTAENIVLATGSEPIEIPGFSFDGEKVLSSSEALNLEAIPPRLAVIGGGYIGIELGMVYAMLGSKVTVVELLDHILPTTSPDLVQVIERRLRQLKMATYTKAMAWKLNEVETGLELMVTRNDETFGVACDKVLLTVGRRPSLGGLDVERIGVNTDDHGFVQVDDQRRTSVPHIYAIGDLAGQPMLAHKASFEGEIVAEVITGQPAACDYQVVPSVIFTDPEIATVGLTETEAKAQGIETRIGRFPFRALGKAQTMDATDGFVKILTDSDGMVLGAEMVGPEVSNLVAEVALAIEMGAEARDIAMTIHTHPTLPEAVMEAAKSVYRSAIHMINEP